MKNINIVAVLLVSMGLAACEAEQEEVQQSQEAPSQTEAQANERAAQAQPEQEEDDATMASQPVTELLAGDHRSDANRARDEYRNPAETLYFFQVDPSDTVIELNPGGGWYMEILAPLVNEDGQYIAATPDPELEGMPGYVASQATQIQERIDGESEHYGNAKVQFYNPSEPSLGEPESADVVLTFRNVHGWINSGSAESMFEAFAEVLKPGGVLGVVQHRAGEGSDPEESVRSGYVAESTVIELAEAAGLTLDGRSDINANPQDTRDHPEGVWTLPPSLRLGDEDREKYMDIGESDRMTLRFVKPSR